jgi:hypothetical protein
LKQARSRKKQEIKSRNAEEKNERMKERKEERFTHITTRLRSYVQDSNKTWTVHHTKSIKRKRPK